jgi:hypothetical protein
VCATTSERLIFDAFRDLAEFGGQNPWLPDEVVPGFRDMFERQYVEVRERTRPRAVANLH